MKLLIAVDGSAHALDAVRHAMRLREAGLRCELVLATVQEPTYLYERILPPTSDVLERISGAIGHEALHGAQALLEQAGVPCEYEIGSGEVAATLLAIARQKGCDGIVLGARGLGAVKGVLLGSVSQAVVQHAGLPVTVVKHADMA